MGANDVPLTTTIGGGSGASKDPTSWTVARNAKYDTTGMGIPGLTGMATGATIFQAIQALAESQHPADGGKLWGQVRSVLQAKAKNYTAKESTSAWVNKDAAGLRALIGGLNSTNSTINKATPQSFLAYVGQQYSAIKTTGTTTTIPKKITSVNTTATPAQLINNILNDQVIPRAKALGSNLKSADLNKIATSLYNSGTYGEPNMIDKAINDATNTAKVIKTDTTTGALGGAIGTKADEMRTVANNYGIPVPQDPNQFANFVKGAVGPGGDISQFTEYAKAQALHLYPWMAGFLTGGDGSTGTGGTVAGYLQPYATNIASTLGIPSTSINWTDPKWQSVVAKKDLNGVSVPQTLDQAIQTVKTDPRFGYDQTTTAKNDAYDAISNIRQLFGFGA